MALWAGLSPRDARGSSGEPHRVMEGQRFAIPISPPGPPGHCEDPRLTVPVNFGRIPRPVVTWSSEAVGQSCPLLCYPGQIERRRRVASPRRDWPVG